MPFKIYLYNIPEVSEYGKQAIPVTGSQVEEFGLLDDAKIFAAEQENNFERGALMQEDNEGEMLIVRRVNGL